MHFSLFSLTLTLTTLTAPILATPYHGQYNLPQDKTIPSTLPETHVYPTSTTNITAPSLSSSAGHGGYGYIHDHPLTNSTSTETKSKTAHAVLPSGTGTGTAATSVSSFDPFTGASAPIKGASLALVIVAGVVVGWF
ncbi:Transcriptional regulatory protein [Venturia nashicola]|uniref:Transcriptional regulatory protein n=1 Tax=Venturia nashicola TaxID=86259 RepID=A0A4Z1PFJ6_9PEZI|nr:Transcriptional regulatory protein [Venturia nashicola]